MEKAKYRAYICCGVNCGPKGASALVDFMEAEVANQGLEDDISVSATGCQAHCDSGPTMVVYPGPVYYQEMDQTRVRRIIKEHLTSDMPVKEYFWTGVRRRIHADGSVIVPKRVAMPEDSGGHVTQSPPRQPKARPRPPDVDDFKW
ncbi:MAG TPA: (2Fe-2S) ferredoxin domain-containing protein [Ktedonobacteraceae bacterium]|nr:(2Fe-2S) ferredoxin domain-containing protein [Ktedonobacteraceae bacterium]